MGRGPERDWFECADRTKTEHDAIGIDVAKIRLDAHRLSKGDAAPAERQAILRSIPGRGDVTAAFVALTVIAVMRKRIILANTLLRERRKSAAESWLTDNRYFSVPPDPERSPA